MGLFSWKTQDTNRSIPSEYSKRPTFKVHMIDDRGNVFTEDNYEGYGIFGNKDFYVLLAEMNGEIGNNEELRRKGLDIAFGNKNYKSPNLIENINNWTYIERSPESCEFQGYFYD